jgi:hypothetical protein
LCGKMHVSKMSPGHVTKAQRMRYKKMVEKDRQLLRCGYSELIIAIINKDIDGAFAIVKESTPEKINEKSPVGSTALMVASWQTYGSGDLTNNYGKRPDFLERLVQEIIAKGGDVDEKDDRGFNALTRVKLESVREILKKHGAKEIEVQK